MEGMEFASLSLIVLVVVFAIGALKKNPLHIGILAMLAAFILGKIAGVKEVAIMGYFPPHCLSGYLVLCSSLPLLRPTVPLNCWQEK